MPEIFYQHPKALKTSGLLINTFRSDGRESHSGVTTKVVETFQGGGESEHSGITNLRKFHPHFHLPSPRRARKESTSQKRRKGQRYVMRKAVFL